MLSFIDHETLRVVSESVSCIPESARCEGASTSNGNLLPLYSVTASALTADIEIPASNVAAVRKTAAVFFIEIPPLLWLSACFIHILTIAQITIIYKL